VIKEGTLGTRVNELAILIATRETSFSSEWNSHEPAALKAGIDQATIDAVRFDRDPSGVPGKDALVIRFGRRLFREKRVSPDIFAQAEALFGKRGTVELVALRGDYALVGRPGKSAPMSRGAADRVSAPRFSFGMRVYSIVEVPPSMFKPALPGVLSIVFLVSPALAQKDFPDAPAKEYVNKICLQCHQPAQLLGQRRTESDWRKTIARMATKGVAAPAEQFDAVAAYMAKNFGKEEDVTKLNMNKAKAEEIAAAIGLTPDEANAVVAFRDKHGEFREWGDMLVIYGVDGLKIEAAKDKMSF
jgi:competence ComEA-like helix-hairpin-helix protein